MLRTLISIATLFWATTVGICMESLKEFNWEHRVVLIFGSSSDVNAQVDDLVSSPHELDDRQMVVLRLSADSLVSVYGSRPEATVKQITADLGVDDVDEFRVVLVGKDGTVKLDRNERVSAVELFGVIDQMPMRRSEADGE
ncbi:MAG: DUF4174 domain-containing protein [Verrucomicrobiaceae bacterium]|nr:MAG: DUF4174 domain-containing protein [Verrucomicrobiaceae bacterium]